jgi:hypothetical protein
MLSPSRLQQRRMRTVITSLTELRRKLEPPHTSVQLIDSWISNSGEAETFLVSFLLLITAQLMSRYSPMSTHLPDTRVSPVSS